MLICVYNPQKPQLFERGWCTLSIRAVHSINKELCILSIRAVHSIIRAVHSINKGCALFEFYIDFIFLRQTKYKYIIKIVFNDDFNFLKHTYWPKLI